MPRKASNLAGQKFGTWTAIERDGKIGTNAAWLCRCENGHEKRIAAHRLKAGDKTACTECAANRVDAIYARDRAFVEAWQRAEYVSDVMAALGITRKQASAVAARLRLNKVPLKRMRSGRSPKSQQHYAAMRELAENALKEMKE